MLSRERAIETLEHERFDVAVIGGGITGAGVALDAASRGYSVALVEKADFASGTSSRSSKLVHGGLRYLQKFDLGLVREALLERQLLVRLAPHLVRPLPLVVAGLDGARLDRLVGIGLNMYDVMATPKLRGRRGARRHRAHAEPDSDWSPERHRVISGAEVIELLPALAARQPTGGYLFYDCQTDDARLVLTVLGEAERFGAICANRLEAVELGDRHGAVPGVRVRDTESDRELFIRAENTINATGVWADRIRPDELHAEAEAPRIAPSRGTHITVADEDLPVVAGAIVPAGENRTIFVLPWLGRTLIGTTDNNYSGPLEHVQPAAPDIAYLLDAVNTFFGTELNTDHLTGAYAGVRPLISTGDTRKSVDISRKAELYETSSGLITITGGKLTTWRRMAKLAVDRLVERDGREAPCRTHEIPLGEPLEAAALARVSGVASEAYEPLASRYGHAATQVLKVAGERSKLVEPMLSGQPDLLAEAVIASRYEQARTVADVLLRRTRLGILAARELCAKDCPAPRRVAEALAAERGWDSARLAAEVERFAQEARAEGITARAEGDFAGPDSVAVFMIAPPRTLRTTRGTLELVGSPLLMGIVNATPDSFSDAGLARDLSARQQLARQHVQAGAAIIDVGGESGVTNRPAVDPDEEIARVVPLIARISDELDVLVSVDTYKPLVAQAALAAGAAIVNDVSGLRDPAMADVCARTGAGLILAHTRAAPKQKLLDRSFDGRAAADVRALLAERIATARSRGVAVEQLMLDPGADLGKTPAQTVEVLRALAGLHELGRPLLLAVSRKDFIGAITARPPRERLAGSLAAVAHGVAAGVHVLRVHDVAETAEFLAVARVLNGLDALDPGLVLAEQLRRQSLGDDQSPADRADTRPR